MQSKLLLLGLVLLSVTLGATTDKYRLVLTDDPASTITVGWNQLSGGTALVRYGTEDFGRDADAYPFTMRASVDNRWRGMHNHFAALSGLEPNTVYYFVLQDDDSVSRRFSFRTAPNDNSPLSFIAGGDSRNNRVPRRKANLLVGKLRPHAVFFGGDMINEDTSTEWRDWFDDWQETIAPDGRMTPIVPARGNHEAPGTIQSLFNTPPGSFYALSWGDRMIRTYTLNSEIPSTQGSNQHNWLAGDLSSATGYRWKMAQFHKPMRPHVRRKREGNGIYNAWARLFFEHDVRLAVDCDSHTTKVTWPVEPSSGPGSDEGFVTNHAYGTVYAGEGCWGAPLRRANDNKEWTRKSGAFNQFNLIHVSAGKIELRVIRTDFADEADHRREEEEVTALPAGLRVWAPDGDDVVTILPRPASAPATVRRELSDNEPPFPNPTRGKVYFRSVAGIQEMTVHRLNGQLVRRVVVAPEVNLTGEAPGVYVIRTVSLLGEVRTWRVILR